MNAFKLALLSVALVLIASNSVAQTGQAAQPSTNGWEHSKHEDPLRGTSSEQFKLEGQYLVAPRDSRAGATPALIVRCTADPRAAHGHARGKFVTGYIFVGGVVDARGSSGTVHAQFRLDDGKLKDAFWSHSTDYSSVFFDNLEFNDLLYGHLLPHKENTGPQPRKLVIGLQEYLGPEVVMQFDLPDCTEVAETCGAIWHK